eukprot:5934203-Prorocentrum_lima.AAC.1
MHPFRAESARRSEYPPIGSLRSAGDPRGGCEPHLSYGAVLLVSTNERRAYYRVTETDLIGDRCKHKIRGVNARGRARIAGLGLGRIRGSAVLAMRI